MRKKKWMCFILCIFVVIALFGCDNVAGGDLGTEDATLTMPSLGEGKNQKTFTVDGVQITLPDDFKESSSSGTYAGFFHEYSAVLLHREQFTLHPSLKTYTLEEYGEQLIQSRNLNTTLQRIDGLLCFEYEVNVEDSSVRYNYFVVLFKTKTDFWIFEFVSDVRETQNHRVEFVQWAKTVKFTD